MALHDKRRESSMQSALIGGLTGAIEITLTFPFEHTKTVM